MLMETGRHEGGPAHKPGSGGHLGQWGQRRRQPGLFLPQGPGLEFAVEAAPGIG
jgi:hypothetical protein